MKPDKLRNIGIVAHIDAGKTTVTERILYYTGVEHRMVEVHDGNAVMDWMEEERERGITITAAATRCPWRGHSIQIIDTPGHVDFTAEVQRSLRVLDGAVVVLCGVAGVQAQTEAVLRQATRLKVPLLIFVNKMDRQGADFALSVASLETKLNVPAIPVQMPIGAGSDFEAVIDLVRMRQYRWIAESDGSEVQDEPIPGAYLTAAQSAREELCGHVAEVSETLTDIYLESGDLTEAQLQEGLRQGVCERKFAPVLAGSALHNQGVQPLLDAILSWMPSPHERAPQYAHVKRDPPGEASWVCQPEPDAPLASLVFKIHHDRFGAQAFVRVYSGQLHDGDTVWLPRLGKRERIAGLFQVHAEHHEKIAVAGPGDIVLLGGLKLAGTGDTLCLQEQPLELEKMKFPEPVIRQAFEPRDPAERDKLGQVLAMMAREDPTLTVREDEEAGAFLVSGMGELHLEVAEHRLEREFGLRARAGSPLVAYREQIAGSTQAEATIELHGDDSPVQLTMQVQLEPQQSSENQLLLPELGTYSGGVQDAMQRLTLLGVMGEYGHPIASTKVEILSLVVRPAEAHIRPEAVEGVLSLALTKAFESGTSLLEPVMRVVIEVPEEFLSGVLGDLQSRGAEVIDLQVGDTIRRLRVGAPLASLFSYSTRLRSLTQGRGTFSMIPHGYDAVPEARAKELLKGLY